MPSVLGSRVVPVVRRRATGTPTRGARSAGGGVRERCPWTHRDNPGVGVRGREIF